MTRKAVILALVLMTASVLVAPAASARYSAGCGGNPAAPGHFSPEVCAVLVPIGTAARDAACGTYDEMEFC